MDKRPKKLFTWDKYLICIIAAIIGICLFLFRQHRNKSKIDLSSIIIAGITFLFALGIIMFTTWYANKPEKDE